MKFPKSKKQKETELQAAMEDEDDRSISERMEHKEAPPSQSNDDSGEGSAKSETDNAPEPDGGANEDETAQQQPSSQKRKKSGGKKKVLLLLPLAAILVLLAGFMMSRAGESTGSSADTSADGSSSDVAASADGSSSGAAGSAEASSSGAAASGSAAAETPAASNEDPLTQSAAVDYIKGLSPSVLGLDGDSMSDYDVQANEALVRFNGQLYRKISVYSTGASGANAYTGTYLLSRSGAMTLYKVVDEANNIVEEIDLGSDEGQAVLDAASSEAATSEN